MIGRHASLVFVAVVAIVLPAGAWAQEPGDAAHQQAQAMAKAVTDAVYLLRHLFLGGPPPPAPFPTCGLIQETTPDCARNACTVGL